MQSYFSKNRIFGLAAVLLITLNVLVLGFVLIREKHTGEHPPGSPRGRIEDLLREELRMTDKQFSDYRDLIEQHKQQRRECKDETRKLRKVLLLSISSGNDSTAQRLSKEIGEREAVFEKQTYDHFKAVYNLLDAEQKKKFGDFMEDVADRLDPGPPPPPGERP